MDGGQEKLCTFNVRCPGARQVYLVGHLSEAGDGAATTVRMRAVRAGSDELWRAVLLLRPGIYRFRYHVDDGSRLTYFSATDRIDSWDAVLTVHGSGPPAGRARRAADAAVPSEGEAGPAGDRPAAWVNVRPPRQPAWPPPEQTAHPGRWA